jgi:hypothetical protein
MRGVTGSALIAAAVLAWAAPATAATSQGDFDDDGYEDLAIGMPGKNSAGGAISDVGAVQVVYGGKNGLTKRDQIWTQASAGITGEVQANDEFGTALAAGDLNGDGRDDLAVGVPGDSDAGPATAGGVHVLYGGKDGLKAGGDEFVSGNGFPGGTVANKRIGTALAIGRFTRGPEDLVVGNPHYGVGDPDEGSITLIEGHTGGFDGITTSYYDPNEDPEGDDRLGAALAAGSFGDGKYDDLLVGVPGQDAAAGVDAGKVIVRYGARGGFEDVDSFYEDDLGVTIEPGDEFGASVAAGDFGKGKGDDAAVGAPFENVEASSAVDAGAVGVLYSKRSGLTATGAQVFDQSHAEIGDPETGDQFGRSLAAGDFGKSGKDELAVGAPLENGPAMADVDIGAVGVLYSKDGTLSGAGSQTIFSNSLAPQGLDDDEQFGTALGAGNVGDGKREDLAIGAPLRNSSVSESGVVNVLYGRSGTLSTTAYDQLSQASSGIQGDPVSGDAFGAALAPPAGGFPFTPVT